jgi:hypothetical protein
MKIQSSTSAGAVQAPKISTKANKTLEAKAKSAIVAEFKKRNPGATNIKVDFPKFEGNPASSQQSLYQHYNFMNGHVSGQVGGKTVEANPRFFAADGKVLWAN